VTTAYLDASALVKIAVDEPESAAVRRYIARFDEVVTSRVGIIEARRAIRRAGGDDAAAWAMLRSVAPLELDGAMAATAAVIEPPSLRTLDAIHVSSALSLYAVDAFVTYDLRLAEAARAADLRVVSPR